MTAALKGITVFLGIGLVEAYYQILMSPDNIPESAIITPFKLHEFLRLSSESRNATQTFQRLIDGVSRGLNVKHVYVDDCLVSSPDRESDLQHLDLAFERLQKQGITVNIQKCQSVTDYLDFLGHIFIAYGRYQFTWTCISIFYFQERLENIKNRWRLR